MKSFLREYINPSAPHHAHLIRGDRETVLADIIHFVNTELDIPTSNNPDFILYSYNSFSIDDVRALQDSHLLKPIVHKYKIIVITINSIPHAAQNALLKMFEEPSGETLFFVVMPSVHMLLPTLHSRFLFIEYAGNTFKASGDRFLEDTYAERISGIKELMEDIKDEKKTRQDALDLFESILKSLYVRVEISKATAEDRHNLKELLRLRDFAYDTSSSLKILLEHIALILPIYK